MPGLELPQGGEHGGSAQAGLHETGARRIKQFAAFPGAVADEKHGPGSPLLGNCPHRPHGSTSVSRSVRRIDGRIDFHPPGVHHGDHIAAALRQEPVGLRLGHQHVQRPDRQQRHAGVGNRSLGRGHAHPQSGIGTGAGAHARRRDPRPAGLPARTSCVRGSPGRVGARLGAFRAATMRPSPANATEQSTVDVSMSRILLGIRRSFGPARDEGLEDREDLVGDVPQGGISSRRSP